MGQRQAWLKYALSGLLIAAALAACQDASAPDDPRGLTWPELERTARGAAVYLAMWTGDAAINRYMRERITPRLRERYNIDLHIVPAQGDIPALLANELAAGQQRSHLDLVWINGETFYKLRQLGALYGPFTDALPNNVYVDWRNPRIAQDFQQNVDGFEAPWGTVQLLLIVDGARLSQPPQDAQALAEWILAHPGRFTFDTAFTGLSFMKSIAIALMDDRNALAGPFDETRYQQARERLFTWLQRVRPALWRKGETFPRDVAQLHQLFASGEIDFTMCMNDGEVENKIANGLFPDSAKAYALSTGTIANSHYLGIVARAPHKAAAMVVINELLSPEAQYEKQQPAIWGDGTVLDIARLPPPWPERFLAIAARAHAPARAELAHRALAEPAAEVMIRLEQDFRAHFLSD